ncbi:Asp23/Gls24 family envelope stress response protein [Streptomyces sp. NBC_01264]|uniref:Asp23/Gls24 family envelope stress response protein n=1 Tax=Streptomyces sp. NBC_01264 TaxID=2903804 RepID=UPI002252E622|nr:Asp23/Gls24 family envelope stress response protein [Streptomyces sp. NBC_01264]MCX4782851.1 Asp23/Gls24 family envelope stress response protein [Streptomyces sp. NBC_01264]
MAVNEPHVPQQGPGAAGDGFLPCGRDLAALWDQQDQIRQGTAPRPADPHTADCGHCGAALEDFARLREAVARDRQDTGADWEAGAARLTASIMDVVRLELRPGHTLALGEADEDAWIHEAVAARAFRTAAERVPGVRAGSCRISPEPSTRPGTRTPARIRIEVTVGMTRDLRAAAEEVRLEIAAASAHELGMPVASVDVTVTDLHHESGDNSGDKEPR